MQKFRIYAKSLHKFESESEKEWRRIRKSDRMRVIVIVTEWQSVRKSEKELEAREKSERVRKGEKDEEGWARGKKDW